MRGRRAANTTFAPDPKDPWQAGSPRSCVPTLETWLPLAASMSIRETPMLIVTDVPWTARTFIGSSGVTASPLQAPIRLTPGDQLPPPPTVVERNTCEPTHANNT